MIFVVKVQLKNLSLLFFNTFLITKTAFLLTIHFFKLTVRDIQTASLSGINLSRKTEIIATFTPANSRYPQSGIFNR